LAEAESVVGSDVALLAKTNVDEKMDAVFVELRSGEHKSIDNIA
jgi:hypothetical protein